MELDRDNLESAAGYHLESMFHFIGLKKEAGLSGVIYPWFIPANYLKILPGYKTLIFKGLIEQGIFVTDFLPGSRPEFGGSIREIYICWSQEAKAKAESEGLTFKIYDDGPTN